jgi:endoglycosylceramidase
MDCHGHLQHLYKMGIVSIVDVHQDGISRYLNGGCGDGFPKWVIPEKYQGQLSKPNNGENCKSWKFNILLDPLVAGTWQAFYANKNGTRDTFLGMWGTVAGAYLAEAPPKTMLR